MPIQHPTAATNSPPPSGKEVGGEQWNEAHTLPTLAELGAVRILASETLGSTANTFADVTIPAGITRVWGHVFYVATAASTPRLRLGGGAIDTGNNYAYVNETAASTTQVTATGTGALTLAHALLANTNTLMVEFAIVKPIAGLGARATWISSGVAAASGTAPLAWSGRGYWNNTSADLGLLRVFSVTTLTGTTAVNMAAGSQLVVYGGG
jgi:hypothetical protein